MVINVAMISNNLLLPTTEGARESTGQRTIRGFIFF